MCFQASIGSDESSVSTFSVSTIASEVSEASGGDAQKTRAKMRLMKKKLQTAEQRIQDRDDAMKFKHKEVEQKEKIIAERDKVSTIN